MDRPEVAVMDYGGGNIGSLVGALDRRQVRYVLTDHAETVAKARAAILPGDGAFAATMQAIRARGLDEAVRAVVAAGKPFLGICVGMQVLFESSDEYGGAEGLGIFRGHVRRFTDAPRVPHMGWNDLRIEAQHPLVQGLKGGEFAYFLHSYRVADSDTCVASADYGGRFAAVVARDNVMATQFHPEKSQRTGGIMLDNFLAMAR
jgi:glutamine amidotransferase